MNAVSALILLSQIYSPCGCYIRLPSHVVIDSEGNCIYWYYDESPDKRNPCIDVPDNATPTDIDGVPSL